MWSEPGGDPIPHVKMAANTDLVIVAPLSANTLAKLALGLADNLLTATLLATPIEEDEGRAETKEEGAVWVLAPAMETHMWQNPLTQAHMAGLVARGAVQVGPGSGRLASGASGEGRMAEPLEIIAAARLALSRRGPLAGRRAHHRRWHAGAARSRPLSSRTPRRARWAWRWPRRRAIWARTSRWSTRRWPSPCRPAFRPSPCAPRSRCAMPCWHRLGQTDILIGAAAVADFRPAEAAAQKIKKTPGQEDLTVRLVRNPDILGEVAAQRGMTGWPRVVVGFAAETQDLLANAAAKLAAKKLDIIVANDVTEPGSGFGADDNRVTLLFADGRQEALPIMAKAEVARRVCEAALVLLEGR